MQFREMIQHLSKHAKEMSVLYVEDEPLIRENISLLLEGIFSKVIIASNGREGLDLFQQHPVDIVITDILMPEMNGAIMIRSIKEIYPEQHFIVTSACEESSYLLELINLGVSQFLLKPIQSEQIVRVLLEVVNNIYNERTVREFTLHLQQDLLHQTTLLEQYKEVVDISSIVIKTDLYGNIIYTNDLFTKISGYSYEEVIQGGHKLLRHPEVNSEFYEELWRTIRSKKTWQGIIKNLKKDGSRYITDTTIKPILDEFEDVIEYISISHDITELFDLNEEIWQTQHEMLSLLGEAGETRSRETGNHVRRVAKYAQLLGELSGLDEEQIRLLYSASPMHDIGKIGIPDAILLKPGKLDIEEYKTMKTHSMLGYDILKNSSRPLLQAAAIIAKDHHEKWDGSGYPNGISGESIHIYGRIVALADVFDALSCERVYKKAWPMEQIIQFISDEKGKHFDPNLVEMFINNIDQFTAIAAELQD